MDLKVPDIEYRIDTFTPTINVDYDYHGIQVSVSTLDNIGNGNYFIDLNGKLGDNTYSTSTKGILYSSITKLVFDFHK